MPYIVGLTGGIASGKTTVANLFHHHFGIEIIDADLIAREVVKPGSEGLDSIISHFGKQVLNQHNELDRGKLRQQIFSDPEQKQWLDSLLHPMIRSKMQQHISKITSPYGLLVVPLLVENQLQSMANRLLVIDLPVTLQIERTMQRDNVSHEQVNAIIAAQASREERLKFADDVLINDADNQQLLPQINKLHHQYLTLCSSV
jgi:dephospho-CoA kinase